MIMKWVIPRILNKFLEIFDPAICVTLNKKKLRIPFLSRVGYPDCWINEPWMINLLKILLPLKDGVFIDIGANVGQTLINLKCVEPSIQYFGFEPNPLCTYCMIELIKKNNFKNCEIIPIGISNKNEIATLNFYNREVDGAATIVENFRSQKIKYKFFVPVQSFEYVYKKLNLKNISIIKIDVEGAELEIIKSLKSVLRDERPFILCEILPVYSKDNTFRKKRQDEIEKIIRTLDYKICRVEKEKNEKLTGLICLNKLGIHSDLSLCDYLFVPNEIYEDVLKQLNLRTNV